jgi:hypothetical protein
VEIREPGGRQIQRLTLSSMSRLAGLFDRATIADALNMMAYKDLGF